MEFVLGAVAVVVVYFLVKRYGERAVAWFFGKVGGH